MGGYAEIKSLGANPPQLRRGWAEVVLEPQPAAGADFSVTVPNNVWWRVLAVTYTFTTSAVVASRIVTLHYHDADLNLLAQLRGSGTAVAAGSAVNQSMWIGAPSSVQNNGLSTYPLPDLILRPGWLLQSHTTLIDAGDQFASIALLVEKYPSDWADGTLEADEHRMLRELLERMTGAG